MKIAQQMRDALKEKGEGISAEINRLDQMMKLGKEVIMEDLKRIEEEGDVDMDAEEDFAKMLLTSKDQFAGHVTN